MYHIHRFEIYTQLRANQSEVARSLSDFRNTAPFPLNAMDENIGTLYRCSSYNLGINTPGVEDNIMMGLIDNHTVLCIPYSEFKEACKRNRDKIYSMVEYMNDEGDEATEVDFENEKAIEVISEINPFYSVQMWLGDRP